MRVLLQLSAGSIVLFSGGFIDVLESELFFLAITMQLLLLCLAVRRKINFTVLQNKA